MSKKELKYLLIAILLSGVAHSVEDASKYADEILNEKGKRN